MNYEVKSLEKCSFSGIKTRSELLEAARSEGAEVEDDAQIFVLLEGEFGASDATYIIEDANDYVFYSNTSLSLFVPDDRDGIIEAVEENKTLSKAMSILGKKTSATKKKSSPENGKKGGRPRLPAGFGYKKFISVAREYRAGNAGNVHNPTMVATEKGFEIWSDMSIDRDVVRICQLCVYNDHMTCTSYVDYQTAIETIKDEKPEFLKIN